MVYEIISVVLAFVVIVLLVVCRIRVCRISQLMKLNRELRDTNDILEAELRKLMRAK